MKDSGCVLFFLFVLVCFVAAQSTWKACNVIPDLNETCVTLSYGRIQDEDYLNVLLTVNSVDYLNQTLLTSSFQRTFCLDQNALVSLMDNNSALSSYSQQVNETITTYGYIPKDDYSVCVALQDTQESGSTITGCTSVSATLMCFDSCSYKGTVSYGCWNLSYSDS
mmetsp:Transcript_17853/g.22687  ORF Transcript_17853/g.22687 Transcript_17853/m.22687 type:complete len:166 (-) Transcript_17853:127-624(-)